MKRASTGKASPAKTARAVPRSRTDWKRVRAQTDADIRFDANSPRTTATDWIGATIKKNGKAIGQDCEKSADGRGGSAHHDCDCGQGLGCTCAFVFPVGVIAHTLPFAAQHLLATVPAVPPRLPVVVTATTRVFRPPIG